MSDWFMRPIIKVLGFDLFTRLRTGHWMLLHQVCFDLIRVGELLDELNEKLEGMKRGTPIS